MANQLVPHRVRNTIMCGSGNGVTVDNSDGRGDQPAGDACNLDGWRGDVLHGGTVKFRYVHPLTRTHVDTHPCTHI